MDLPCTVLPGPSDKLKCSRFRRHTVHLEKKVEVFVAEGFLFQQQPRNLFQVESDFCR